MAVFKALRANVLIGLRTKPPAKTRLPPYGMINIVNAKMGVTTKADWSSSLGPALRRRLGGAIASKMSQTTSVVNLRLSSKVMRRSFISTGHRGLGGRAVAQMLE